LERAITRIRLSAVSSVLAVAQAAYGALILSYYITLQVAPLRQNSDDGGSDAVREVEEQQAGQRTARESHAVNTKSNGDLGDVTVPASSSTEI